MAGNVLELLQFRQGHFVFESGDHGDHWLDLDPLFTESDRIEPYIAELAGRLGSHHIEVLCGPMSGGAFLAQALAKHLKLPFAWSDRFQGSGSVQYRIPGSLRASLRGKRVAVVDDAISAGSAIGATIDDLRKHSAIPAGIGAVVITGPGAETLAQRHHLPLEHLARLDCRLWPADGCPLCASGIPIDPISASTPTSSAAAVSITLEAFDRAEIPLEQWNHRAHLTIAYLLLRSLPLEDATDRMRAGVQGYNDAKGITLTPASGYHETLTVAWMRILHASMKVYGPGNSADEFFSQHPHLLSKVMLRLFYSRERIMSAQARSGWVEPDLAPLPKPPASLS